MRRNRKVTILILGSLTCFSVIGLSYLQSGEAPHGPPPRTFRFALEKGMHVFVGGVNSNYNRAEWDNGVDPFRGLHVPKASKAGKPYMRLIIGRQRHKPKKAVKNWTPRWVIRVAWTTKLGGANIPYEFNTQEGETAIPPEKIKVPLSLDGVSAYLFPYAKSSEGRVRSVLVVLADSRRKLKGIVETTNYAHPRFSWTDEWFAVLDK